jgi:hypothetical protein
MFQWPYDLFMVSFEELSCSDTQWLKHWKMQDILRTERNYNNDYTGETFDLSELESYDKFSQN